MCNTLQKSALMDGRNEAALAVDRRKEEVAILRRIEQAFRRGERTPYGLPAVCAAILMRWSRLDHAAERVAPTRLARKYIQKVCYDFLDRHERKRRHYRGRRQQLDAQSWGPTEMRVARKLRGRAFTDSETGVTVRYRLWDEMPIPEGAEETLCLVPQFEWPATATAPPQEPVYIFTDDPTVPQPELASGADITFIRFEQGVRFIADLFHARFAERFPGSVSIPVTVLFDTSFIRRQYAVMMRPALASWNTRLAEFVAQYGFGQERVFHRLLAIPDEKPTKDQLALALYALHYQLSFGLQIDAFFVDKPTILHDEFGGEDSSATKTGWVIHMDRMYDDPSRVVPARDSDDALFVAHVFDSMERWSADGDLFELRYDELTYSGTPDPELDAKFRAFLHRLQHGVCAVCERKLKPGWLDYVVPPPIGNNSLANLRLLCRQGAHRTLAPLSAYAAYLVADRRLTDHLPVPTLQALEALGMPTLHGIRIGPHFLADLEDAASDRMPRQP